MRDLSVNRGEILLKAYVVFIVVFYLSTNLVQIGRRTDGNADDQQNPDVVSGYIHLYPFARHRVCMCVFVKISD